MTLDQVNAATRQLTRMREELVRLQKRVDKTMSSSHERGASDCIEGAVEYMRGAIAKLEAVYK